MEKQYTILVVDDTKSNIEILLTHLGKHYNVIPSLTGKRALDIVEKKQIDLILLDIIMPEIDGYEVCTLLKENYLTRAIPVIFITAQTNEDAIEKAYDAGGIDYIAKPFRPKELLARIKRELTLQQLIKDLEASKEELRILATTDPMTKLYNRRSFANISANLLGQSKRESQAMSVLMIDIDKFKGINDTHGHDVGDTVIITMAENLRNMSRTGDIICRYGGEEFVLLLPNTRIDGARTLGEKIRRQIEESTVKIESGGQVHFTVSIGATEVDVPAEKNLEPALKRADVALYQAKEGGRNKLVTF
ncbi:diguanylate cyclase [Desulfobacter curvatus]|uniref:diguanylate cyclase n=1 Tax=Desulfobacter curvatus TaxID=2290 RepID=UPI000360DA08|nr:diguanylate cyclase [Desulfobacter curvatus]